ETVDGHGTQRHPRLERHGHRRIDPGEFLERETQGEVVAAHTAVLLGKWQAEQAHRAHLRDDLVGELLADVEVADHGFDLGLGEVVDRLAQRFVLVVEPEVDHDVCSRGVTSASFSSNATCLPAWTQSSATTPSTGAVIVCSIFITSTTASGVPAATWSPSATFTTRTVPGIGLVTGPPSTSSACPASRFGRSPTATATPSRLNHSAPSGASALA